MFEPFQKKSEAQTKVWFTYEDCKLCREHCREPGQKMRPIINWPELPYPGKDQSCVGYCPREF